MARRMGFSVVGLPHYTVWHLYEPSVDDLQHMEEMEAERKERGKEERERAERAQKLKNEFSSDSESQWDKDKSELESLKQLEKEKKGDEAGPKSPPKEPVRDDEQMMQKAVEGEASPKKKGSHREGKPKPKQEN
jgi:mannan polymerase II complex ANP1 subunit